MLSCHGGLDHDPLQGPAVFFPGRLGPEIVEAEPAGQLPAGVVSLPAPLAVVAGAGGVAQHSDQSTGAGELMAHPGRHDGVASGHRQPRQRVGQLPRAPFGICQRRCSLGPARRSGEATFDGRVRLGIGWPRRLAQVGEEVIEPRAVVRASEPVPGGDQVGIRLPEGPLLVGEDLQRQPGVQFGVVEAAPPKRTVLVVLHQVVVRIAGKRQGIEAQRVYCWHPQQPEVGVGGSQVGQVKVDEVVAQQEVGALGQVVQPDQRLGQPAAAMGEREGFIGIRPHAGQGVDPSVVPADLQVQGQTAR